MLRSKLSLQEPISRHLTLQKSHINNPIINNNKKNPNQLLFEKLLSHLTKCISIKQLQQIQTQMLINSIHKPNFLLSKAIDLKSFAYASALFAHIPEPNDYAFNVMIRGLSTTWQKYGLALEFHCQMKGLGLKTNKFTYPFVFIACANLSTLNHGRTAHSSVFKIGLDGDEHVSNSLITMYARCGELGSARKAFDEITQRGLSSWNSMISGYSKMGYAREAVELFGEMRDAGIAPVEMTLVSVLGSCGDLGDLSLGRWVEEFVVEKSLEVNSYLGSALIGMYGKCGDLCSARRVFDSMTKKDLVTWNAMISG